ncbi:unnamed protein product [Pelagomonas calceolata]|uniref:Mitochondrial-processing peptidase subunit alpha n=1 Tax=Pelagomonas calceolata TaxID=35677 RepID=A0A8J2SU72_9STRA|nr:unnamed protein product [Pelagomonas calceolata]
MRSALRRATAARRRRHKSGMPADYAMVPPFPRGGWNAHQPPFPEIAPTTQLTTLPSGLRVVSQETHTYMSAIGVVICGGAADEKAHLGTVGGAQLAEVCAWRGTRNSSTADVLKRAEACGRTCTRTRSEQSRLYCIDALRDKLEDATQLLAEACLLGPDLEAPGAMDEVREGMELAFLGATLGRARPGKHPRRRVRFIAVGRAALCPPSQLHTLSPKTLADFRALITQPQSLVVAGASPYVGGCVLAEERAPTPSGYAVEATPQVRIACAMRAPEGGWHSKDLIACCVLQTLLGGGDSFSAGGPGKGMYSRLYREVLNRYHWVEACEAFVSIHDREGLLGIVGACAPASAHHLTEVLMSNLLRLGQQPVERSELDRAKNMLKVNVLTQLESRLVLFEDIARQVATFGRRQTLQEMTAAVDAVTEEDILRIGQYMCAAPPSMAAHGEDLSRVPPYEQVRSWRLRTAARMRPTTLKKRHSVSVWIWYVDIVSVTIGNTTPHQFGAKGMPVPPPRPRRLLSDEWWKDVDEARKYTQTPKPHRNKPMAMAQIGFNGA